MIKEIYGHVDGDTVIFGGYNLDTGKLILKEYVEDMCTYLFCCGRYYAKPIKEKIKNKYEYVCNKMGFFEIEE